MLPCRCRKDEFSTIVPRQPYRPESTPNEVRLEFEAVLLDVNKDRKNQLWIHAKIKACVAKGDCEAVSSFLDRENDIVDLLRSVYDDLDSSVTKTNKNVEPLTKTALFTIHAHAIGLRPHKAFLRSTHVQH